MFVRRSRHPLELLPDTKIPLKQWKGIYMNDHSTSKQQSLSYFWNEFYNNEEWSLWKVDYKYNDEIDAQFKFDNLISGFFNRLLETVKFISGVTIVYRSEEGQIGITGAFVIRGCDYKTAFSSAPEWDSFEYTQLNPESKSDVKFIDQIWGKNNIIDINGKSFDVINSQTLLGSRSNAMEDFYEILTESEEE